MVPAHERLDARDRCGSRVDDGLVVHLELVVHQSVVQVLDRVQTFERAFLHAIIGNLVAPVTALLGDVHREVRVAQECAGVPGALAHGDADAGGDRCLVVNQDERCAKHLGDTFC